MTTDRRYSIFVYGTLRPGHGNARLWQGRAAPCFDGSAYVIGFMLTTQGYFPYLVESATSQTVGCLIDPDDEHYDDVLADMDRLEGVPTHYRRILINVCLPGGIITAWTYVPAPSPRYVEQVLPAVATNPDGYFDWDAHQPRHRRTERNTR